LVESDESFVRDDAAALQPSLIALQLPLAPMRALECGALHSFCDPARSGTIAAFAVWSFVSVLIVPARKLGLGASYPRRFGRLFRDLILSSLPDVRCTAFPAAAPFHLPDPLLPTSFRGSLKDRKLPKACQVKSATNSNGVADSS
jgi:hypothetical protein